MKSFCGSVNARCRGERAEADGYADAADGYDSRAGALQDSEDNSGPA
jgi:hypothetical protein